MHARLAVILVWVLGGGIAACASESDANGVDQEQGAGDEARNDEPRDSADDVDEPAENPGDELSAPNDEDPVTDPASDETGFPDELLPDELLPELELEAPKAGGRIMFSDIIALEPSEDVTYCTFTDVITEDIEHIHDTIGQQTAYGHHVILYYTTEIQEPGTKRCTNADMETMRQVLGGSGGDGALGGRSLPGNVVSEIPKGAQFVLSHHWINYGEEAVEAQASLVTEPAEGEPEDLVVVRSLAFIVANFNIAPGTSGEATGSCEFEQDMDFLYILGHEHEWGTHISWEHQPAQGEPEMIFDHEYNAEYVAHPNILIYPLDAPLSIKAGDKAELHCEWFNDTDQPLTWPLEMCIAFGWKIGGDRDAVCFNGAWVSQ